MILGWYELLFLFEWEKNLERKKAINFKKLKTVIL